MPKKIHGDPGITLEMDGSWLVEGAGELALATVYRAALHAERRDEIKLPKDPNALEVRLSGIFQDNPELREQIAAGSGLRGAGKGKLNAELRKAIKGRLRPTKSGRDRRDAFVERIDLTSEQSLLELDGLELKTMGGRGLTVGQVSPELEGKAFVSLYVHAVQCIVESDPTPGADDLQALVSIFAASGEVASMKGWVDAGDFDTGDPKHVYDGLDDEGRPDENDLAFGTSLALDKINVGDLFVGAISLRDSDSISEGWKAFAEALHTAGLIALWAYVVYQTGGDVSKANASVKLADEVGQYIAKKIDGLNGDEYLGTGKVTWAASEGGFPEDYVDIASAQHNSHYRVFFRWTGREVTFTNPNIEVGERPFTFVQLGRDQHVDVAVCADGTDEAWVVSASGKVSRVVGEAFAAVAQGFTQVSLGSTSQIWAVDGDGGVHQWQDGAFVRRSGALAQIAAGADDTIWGADSEGWAVRRAREVNGRSGLYAGSFLPRLATDIWERIGELSFVTCGSSQNIVALDAHSATYRWANNTQKLEQMVTTPVLRQLSAASDKSVYAVDSAGNLFDWLVKGGAWRPLQANIRIRKIANAGRGLLYALDMDGRLWRFDNRNVVR